MKAHTAKPRRNPRKVVAYLTQYGAWWSATEDQWRRLVALGTGQAGGTFTSRGKTYAEFDLDAVATRLRGQPSSLRTESYTDRSGYGRRAFHSTVPVVHPLDFDTQDWAAVDDEVQSYIRRSR